MDGTAAEASEEMDKAEVAVKMSGYLEKRGKFRLVATWKRYWFVLEGRLLLYYGSEQDYVNLSACRGSINMGLVSCVRPGSARAHKQHDGFTIEVVTRTHLVVLRMKDRSVQEQWLQALLDSAGGSQQGQTLANSGSGTLHLRYSMDALPTAVKKEASLEEKQSTLPRPKQDSARARQQSIMQHIKRIGGKTYVGSLDTVLKVRNNAYGSGNQENFPENIAVNGHMYHESMNQEASEEKKAANKISSPSETMNADVPNCKQESKLPRKSEENPHTQGQNHPSVPDTNSCKQEPKVQLHSPAELVDRGAEQNNISSTSQAPAFGKESDTSQGEDCPSEDDMLPAAKEGKVIENKLYHQNNGSVNKLCSSESNLNSQNCQSNHLKCSDISDIVSNEKEKHFENIATNSSMHPEEKHNSFTSNEDIYYSCYDKASLIEQLKNEQLDPTEPELPPRPHVSSGSSGTRTGSTSTVMEDDGAEYCVLGSAEPPLSPSTHSAASSVEEPVNKKWKNKHGAKKKKKKENSESENADENDKKVKRKISFIHRLMGKYHKKKSKSQNINDVESLEENDGTEYAVIDYEVIQSNMSKESVLGKNKQLKEEAEETHDKCAVNLCSAKSLLPNSTFQELQQRLRQRVSPHSKGESSEEELDYEAEYAETQKEPDVSNTPSVSRRKPVPAPRKNAVQSTEEFTYELDPGSVQQASSTPPKLPPRRLIRPRSPWHDVPSNNSPVYGNFEEIFGARHRDSLLGTPEGYALIKNKWQAAEMCNSPRTKGTQWNRELRQVTFPSRLGQRVLQWQEEASGDSTCDCCSHDDKEQRTQHTIIADIERHTSEKECMGPGLTATTTNQNSTSTADLCPSHSPQDSSRESSMTTSSVSNSCNEITLVAAIHYEDTCSLQDRDRYDEWPGVSKMVTHETTNQGPNTEYAEKSKVKKVVNTHTSVESATLNILRSASDEQLSTDGAGKSLKLENVAPFENKCDKLSPVVTESLSKQINAEELPASQGEGNAMSVENETPEFTSVCDIILTDSHPCSRESINKSHGSITCASTNENINDIDPDSLMSDNTSECSGNFCDKQEHGKNSEVCHEPNWNMCKCMSNESCKNCTKKVSNKSLPDSHYLGELNDDSLEIFEEVELRKHSGVAMSSNVAHTATFDGSTCPTCSSKAVSPGRKVIFDGTKAIQCILYDDNGCITDKQVVPVMKRYSDELNLLLSQLAEITSAPLLSPGVTISLVDFPEKRKHSGEVKDSEFDEWAAVGPIRRRRHSDPDYDVPRPHRSLLQLQLSSVEKKRLDGSDVIEATKFFGKTESCDVPKPNTSTKQVMLWPGHTKPGTCSQNTRTSRNQIQNQSDDPSFSITPDSLELTQP